MIHRITTLIVIATACLVAAPALAHTNAGALGGFGTGFMHPLSGWDHMVAMAAVGLWGAFLGMPAIWLLPVVFPLVMTVGGALGIAGVPLPGIEVGIAVSAIVLGLVVAAAFRAPLWAAGILVGVFAIFHGYAHGAELPNATSPLTYSLGFVVATGSIHLLGIALGMLTRWSWGTVAVRALGGVISACGVVFLVGVLS